MSRPRSHCEPPVGVRRIVPRCRPGRRRR